MLGHRQLTLEDYLAIARHRVWLLILPPVLLCLAAYLVSLVIPSRYASQTQVLVQAQSVPTDIVQPVITEGLNDLLASMKEQILSRTRLQPIVERFNLYSGSKASMEAKVQKLHDSIQVDAIHPMEETRAAQLPGFRITATMNDPYLAQSVCREITSMFLEEDIKSRETRAEGTTDFLDQQLDDATKNMNEQDAKLAAFKSKYLGPLPEDTAATLGMLGSLNTELDAVTQGLERDIQTRSLNQSLLDQQIAAWKSSQATSSGVSPDTLQEQLKKAQDELANLQAHYTDQWPAVRAKKAEVEELKKKFAAAQANKPPLNTQEKTPDAASNSLASEPQPIQGLRAQISAINIAIQEKTKQQEDLRNKIRTYEGRLQLSPVVEQQYRELTRDFTTATDEYNTLLKQRGSAARGAELERRQQGEQFRILDPANLPEKPVFPNRIYFAGEGFAGGLALGLGLILLLEMRDKSLRTESDVELFLKLPTLAVVPVIDKKSAARKRFVIQASNGGPALDMKT